MSILNHSTNHENFRDALYNLAILNLDIYGMLAKSNCHSLHFSLQLYMLNLEHINVMFVTASHIYLSLSQKVVF
jgi:hypothetical protein